jgi:hypothetical protein
MVRKLVGAYVLGALSVLGFAYHAGADAIVQAGLKLAALQTSYVYDAKPAFVVDEQLIVAELAKPVTVRKGGARQK